MVDGGGGDGAPVGQPQAQSLRQTADGLATVVLAAGRKVLQNISGESKSRFAIAIVLI